MAGQSLIEQGPSVILTSRPNCGGANRGAHAPHLRGEGLHDQHDDMQQFVGGTLSPWVR